MGKYNLRNGKITGTLQAKKVLTVAKDANESNGVAYIKLQQISVGTAGSPDGYAYLYLGSAGSLCLASSAPVGTSGEFSNTGKVIATSA